MSNSGLYMGTRGMWLRDMVVSLHFFFAFGIECEEDYAQTPPPGLTPGLWESHLDLFMIYVVHVFGVVFSACTLILLNAHGR